MHSLAALLFIANFALAKPPIHDLGELNQYLKAQPTETRIKAMHANMRLLERKIADLKNKEPKNPLLIDLIRSRNMIGPFTAHLDPKEKPSRDTCSAIEQETASLLGFGEPTPDSVKDQKQLKDLQQLFCEDANSAGNKKEKAGS